MVRADAEAKQLDIQFQLNAAVSRANGDPARLQQVFWNLLQNAVKFTAANGRITISSQNNASGKLVLQVQDTGIGIDATTIPRIFNAFDEGGLDARCLSRGLGLGLAISKAIIDGHEGKIEAHSEGKGQGSKFAIELPTVSESGSHNIRPEQPASASVDGELSHRT